MADRRLQVFYAVARFLSFTKAAEHLHMTQPAVTFQVRQLEEYFGARLFDRTHNKIRLTESGHRAFAYADRIFALYDEMESSVRELTGEVSGILKLGASTTLAEYVLPHVLSRFKTAFPDVQIRLKESNSDGVGLMVENNQVDLGLVEFDLDNRNLHSQKCGEQDMVLVVSPSHPLAAQQSVKAEDLGDFPWICREEGSATRTILLDYLERYGMAYGELDVVMELGSPESIKGAIAAGLGMSILTQATIEKELKLGDLVAVRLDPPLRRPFYFIHKKQKYQLKAMDELLNFIYQYFNQNPV